MSKKNDTTEIYQICGKCGAVHILTLPKALVKSNGIINGKISHGCGDANELPLNLNVSTICQNRSCAAPVSLYPAPRMLESLFKALRKMDITPRSIESGHAKFLEVGDKPMLRFIIRTFGIVIETPNPKSDKAKFFFKKMENFNLSNTWNNLSLSGTIWDNKANPPKTVNDTAIRLAYDKKSELNEIILYYSVKESVTQGVETLAALELIEAFTAEVEACHAKYKKIKPKNNTKKKKHININPTIPMENYEFSIKDLGLAPEQDTFKKNKKEEKVETDSKKTKKKKEKFAVTTPLLTVSPEKPKKKVVEEPKPEKKSEPKAKEETPKKTRGRKPKEPVQAEEPKTTTKRKSKSQKEIEDFLKDSKPKNMKTGILAMVADEVEQHKI